MEQPLNNFQFCRTAKKAGAIALVLAVAISPSLLLAQSLPRDYGVGFKWHESAAESGMVEAQYRLGVFHETGCRRSPRGP